MFYRVTADLLFTDEDEARDFFHDCQMACPKSMVVHPGEENEERGHCMLVACRHNETPYAPCSVLDEIWCPPKPPEP